MTNCLNCNKELIHIEGRRKKKFCNNSCRVTHWQKTHAKLYCDETKSATTTCSQEGTIPINGIEPKNEEKKVPSWKAAYDEYMKNQNQKTKK